MDKLIELLISSGPPALIVLVGLVWGKNLIEYFFKETIEIKKDELAQNLENYKKEIEQENKNFQHQLDTKLQEFNIKFSSLHIERAEVIKNLYSKLIELQSSMFNYTRRGHIVVKDSEKEEFERIKKVNNALTEFSSYYRPNKIYFSSSISSKIGKLLNEYRITKINFSFTKDVFKYRSDYTPDEIKENYIEYKKLSEKVEKDFPPLIKELENDFREILGVKN